MRDVDYVKLSEQYASFLIAIGGVSITVFSIVSSFGNGIALSVDGNISSFVGAALIVATVSCFIGAHMMAETAAFNNHFKDKKDKLDKGLTCGEVVQVDESELTARDGLTFGKRLFLLASTNIFIAINLVLFAIVLLPAAKAESHGISPVYFTIFASVGCGALYWMVLASKYRMPVNDGWCAKKLGRPLNDNLCAIIIAGALGLAWWLILFFVPMSGAWLLLLTFAPIVAFTVATLVFFARIFRSSTKVPEKVSIGTVDDADAQPIPGDNTKAAGKAIYKGPRLKVNLLDTAFFGSAVTISYASLLASGIRLGALKLLFW